jgi:hypothetical protein
LNKLATAGFPRTRADRSACAEKIKAWTRRRFSLADDAAVMVAELACALPGCPPIETVIAFWTEGDKRHHFKVFKPLAEVVEDDLPPAFMKNGLADLDGIDCACC